MSGEYTDVPRPVDMCALFTLGGVSSTGFIFPFNIGNQVTIQVKGAGVGGWGGVVDGGGVEV